MNPEDVYKIIVEDIALDILSKFLEKSADYGDAWRLLGAKGQFSDINRKFWKLYNSIWLDKELVGEQPDECVEDIIGHCLILLYIMRYESTPERANFSSPPDPLPHPVPAADPLEYPEDERRCAATRTAGENVVRCERYMGHPGRHLSDIGTMSQYQWETE